MHLCLELLLIAETYRSSRHWRRRPRCRSQQESGQEVESVHDDSIESDELMKIEIEWTTDRILWYKCFHQKFITARMTTYSYVIHIPGLYTYINSQPGLYLVVRCTVVVLPGCNPTYISRIAVSRAARIDRWKYFDLTSLSCTVCTDLKVHPTTSEECTSATIHTKNRYIRY